MVVEYINLFTSENAKRQQNHESILTIDFGNDMI